MKSNKTLLWVGIGSALLIGGGLFWWFRKSSQEKEAAAAKLAQEAEDKAAQEKEKEIVKKEKVEDNTPTLPSTPFKNKTEGDAFRVWMSETYPKYRYKNDTLGKSGEYNNSFMKDAYNQYGAEYQLFLTKKAADVKVKDAVKDNSSLTPLQQVEQNLKWGGSPVEVYTDKIVTIVKQDGDSYKAFFHKPNQYKPNEGLYVIFEGSDRVNGGVWYEGGKKIVLKPSERIISNARVRDNIIQTTKA